jgi:hypothetical protein
MAQVNHLLRGESRVFARRYVLAAAANNLKLFKKNKHQ